MEFEIIQKEVKTTYPKIFCFVCDKSDKTNYSYAMMKNTFYCDDCLKDLPNVNSIIDTKFNDLYKKYEDLLKGLVDKNNRIKKLEAELQENNNKFDVINKIIELIDEHNKKEENK